jgi:glutathione-regulated potassium-efflux system ancillary protein KefG
MTTRLRSLPVPPRRVNLDDLIDTDEVADLIGLSTARSITTYRARFADFPAPVIERGSGRCLLWLRPEVMKWLAKHPGIGKHKDHVTPPA